MLVEYFMLKNDKIMLLMLLERIESEKIIFILLKGFIYMIS